MLLNPLESGFGFGANLAHPGGGSVLQFRVVFVLPGSRGFLECVTLPAALNLLAGCLGQERAATALADQFIDFGNQICRHRDAHMFSHESSVT